MFSQVLVEKSLTTPYFGRVDVSWMVTIWKIHLSTICIARFSFPRVKQFFLGLLTHSFWACVYRQSSPHNFSHGQLFGVSDLLDATLGCSVASGVITWLENPESQFLEDVPASLMTPVDFTEVGN